MGSLVHKKTSSPNLSQEYTQGVVISSAILIIFGYKEPMISPSKNDVGTDLQDGVKEERYKRCVNLSVKTIFSSMGSSTMGYITDCTQESFLGVTDRRYYDRLKQGRAVPEPYVKCPPECVYFRDIDEARKQKRKQQRWENFWKPFNWCWTEFKELHWPVQLGIIGILFLLVLWLVAPGLIPQFIQLIEAIRGS